MFVRKNSVTRGYLEGNNLAWNLFLASADFAQHTGGASNMRLGGKLPSWATLTVFLILGAALIFISHFYQWQRDYGITSEIGVAFLVAAILGFTIDRWMKAELRTDAFLAAIGHVLAPEFRAEVSRIVGYKLICEKHLLLINIEHVSNELIKVTTSTERTIRNRSAYPQKINNIAHIDEWGYQVGHSQILECVLKIDGVEIRAEKPQINSYSVYCETAEKTLKPNQEATLRSKYIDYKPVNDDLHYSFAAPTVNPEIEVHAPDDLDWFCNFGTPDENAENVVVSGIAPKRQLKGTYFPHQSMRIRWWPKSKQPKTP
jgi:hypothetical protein